MDGAARKHPITVNSSKNLSYHEYFAHRYFLTICLVHSCYVKVRTDCWKSTTHSSTSSISLIVQALRAKSLTFTTMMQKH